MKVPKYRVIHLESKQRSFVSSSITNIFHYVRQYIPRQHLCTLQKNELELYYAQLLLSEHNKFMKLKRSCYELEEKYINI